MCAICPPRPRAEITLLGDAEALGDGWWGRVCSGTSALPSLTVRMCIEASQCASMAMGQRDRAVLAIANTIRVWRHGKVPAGQLSFVTSLMIHSVTHTLLLVTCLCEHRGFCFRVAHVLKSNLANPRAGRYCVTMNKRTRQQLLQ